MMVNHSGWTAEHGSYSYDVFVDEHKTDYEIHFRDGSVFKQDGSFHEETADWNHDGDRYTQFGAWFRDSVSGRGIFWTPVDLVTAVIDAKQGGSGHGYGEDISHIPGICVPALEKRPSLKEQVLRSERRSAAQEAERNRNMKSLGIRAPGEPWAR